ncbi:arginase family protein [Sporolactobacillus vineae]|uniref:arginase family protein n=1 Tax=Sporolactobacillus vineae TaxID=444463 RepID=UPI0002885652|nr:arginase family protein [Sporolactobacillus vineae]
MPLVHRNITFLNFDDTYVHQKNLTAAVPHQWIDFTGLRGTAMYCSPGAFASIGAALGRIPDKGLTFIGSGNYHYVALALMQEIRRPFTLVLFDHHTDLNAGQIGPLLSCGSWVSHAIQEVPELKKVIMIGPDPRSARDVPQPIRRQVVIIPDHSTPAAGQLLKLIQTDTVQISVDKDVLSTDEVKTNWSQGRMRSDTLLPLVRTLIEDKRIASMDVCGGWPIRPHEHFNPQIRTWLSRNEAINKKLAGLFISQLIRTDASAGTRHIAKSL